MVDLAPTLNDDGLLLIGSLAKKGGNLFTSRERNIFIEVCHKDYRSYLFVLARNGARNIRGGVSCSGLSIALSVPTTEQRSCGCLLRDRGGILPLLVRTSCAHYTGHQS